MVASCGIVYAPQYQCSLNKLGTIASLKSPRARLWIWVSSSISPKAASSTPKEPRRSCARKQRQRRPDRDRRFPAHIVQAGWNVEVGGCASQLVHKACRWNQLDDLAIVWRWLILESRIILHTMMHHRWGSVKTVQNGRRPYARGELRESAPGIRGSRRRIRAGQRARVIDSQSPRCCQVPTYTLRLRNAREW